MSERQQVQGVAKEWKAPKSARSATHEHKIDSPHVADSAQALDRALAGRPRALAHSDLLSLQRSIGNQAVYRLLAKPAPSRTTLSAARSLVQTKLMVGPAGDQYEQEADRVAQQVMNERAPSGTESARRTEEDEVGPLAAAISPIVRRDEQRADGGFEAGEEFEQGVSSLRGGGSPLPAGLRAYMEPRFGADFSGVRIHNDLESDQLNRAIQARAFTAGQDMFFRQGAYDPSSRTGQELIAHELTHVIQQSGGAVRRRTEWAGPLISRSPVAVLQNHRNAPNPEENIVVQRKTGFEIQTNFPMRRWKGQRLEDIEYRTKTFMDKTVGVSDEKFSVAPYFHIEADNRGVEFEKSHKIIGQEVEKPEGNSIMEFVTGAFDPTSGGQELLRIAMERINLFMNIVKEKTTTGPGMMVELQTVANAYNQKLNGIVEKEKKPEVEEKKNIGKEEEKSRVEVLEHNIVLGGDSSTTYNRTPASNVKLWEKDLSIREIGPKSEKLTPQQEQEMDKYIEEIMFEELTSSQLQTTFSTALENLPGVLTGLLNLNQSFVRHKMRILNDLIGSVRNPQSKSAALETKASLEFWDQQIKEFDGTLAALSEIDKQVFSKIRWCYQPPITSKEIINKTKVYGFLFLVELTLHESLLQRGKPLSYAKSCFTFMHRVDFNSLFESLAQEERQVAQQYLMMLLEEKGKFQMFPGGIKPDPQASMIQVPTAKAWITSIYREGTPEELTKEDYKRIFERAERTYRQEFFLTPLGKMLKQETSKKVEARSLLEIFTSGSVIILSALEKDYPSIKPEYEKACKLIGERGDKLLAIGCAQMLSGKPLIELDVDIKNALDRYMALGKHNLSEKPLPLTGLIEIQVKEYLKKDLLSRGQITKDEASKSMGWWGAIKAKEEGAILEWRNMIASQEWTQWEYLTLETFKKIMPPS